VTRERKRKRFGGMVLGESVLTIKAQAAKNFHSSSRGALLAKRTD